MRALVFGWYGAGNLGDEMLLRLFSAWAAEKGAETRAISIDPVFTHALHGIPAVDFHDLTAVAQEMWDADLFALGGGGLFQTHHPLTLHGLYDFTMADIAAYARPMMLARQCAVPTLAWAQGVGPLGTPEGREIAREVFEQADNASVRDEPSAAVLREAGVQKRPVVAPDPIWAYPLPSSDRSSSSELKIAVIVRPWLDDSWHTKLIDAIAATPADVVTWHWIPASWHGVPGRADSDHALIQSLVDRLPSHRHQLADVSGIDDVLLNISRADGCIAMRLHAQIAALRYDIPTVCIEYDPKMESASQHARLDREARLSLDDDSAAWHARIAALVAGRVPRAGRGEVTHLEACALEHRRVLHEALQAARGRRRPRAQRVDWLWLWNRREEKAWRGQHAQKVATIQQRLDAALEQGLLVSDMAGRLDTLAKAHDELTSRVRSIAAATDEAAGLYSLASKRLEEIEQRCTSLATTASEQAIHVTALRDITARAEVTIEAVTTRLARTERQLDIMTKKRDATEREFGRVADALERQIALLEQASERQSTDQSAIAVLQAQLHRVDNERAHLQKIVARLDRQIRDIHASTSWRITRPLRAFKTHVLGAPAEAVIEPLPVFTPAAASAITAPLADAVTHDLSWEEFEAQVLRKRDDYRGIFVQEIVIDWNVPLFQRPQHIAVAMARRGFLVIYKTVNWNGDDVNGFRQVAKGVWLTNRPEVDGLRRVVRSVYSTAYADDPANLCRRPADSVMVYEYIDHIDPQISGDDDNIRRLLQLKKWGFENADIIVASARQLEHEARRDARATEVLFVPNGVDTRHYRNPRHRGHRLPKALEDFASSHDGVVGYFGAMAPWLWYAMIEDVVRMRPDLGFVFIGPDYYGGSERLPNAPNVMWLGPVDYQVLPSYGQIFDVCFIPFAPGDIARSTSPLKLFEYFALEKPVVVSDDMLECTVYPEVFRGGDAQSIARAIDDALRAGKQSEFRARLRDLADQNDWDCRARVMEQAFDRLRNKR